MSLETEIWAMKCHAETANFEPSNINLRRLRQSMTMVSSLISDKLGVCPLCNDTGFIHDDFGGGLDMVEPCPNGCKELG